MPKTFVLPTLMLACVAAFAQKMPLPPMKNGQDDVHQTAILMMRMGGSYEGDINGGFAQALRKQLRDPTVRVTMRGKVLEQLEDGCVWAEFTAKTPDKRFATVIKNKTLIYAPCEISFTGRYCEKPEKYIEDDDS